MWAIAATMFLLGILVSGETCLFWEQIKLLKFPGALLFRRQKKFVLKAAKHNEKAGKEEEEEEMNKTLNCESDDEK